MLVDKIFSGKLHEYKDVCRLMRSAFPKNEQIAMWMLRVLASDTDHFDSKEYEMLLSRFSFGTYKKHIAR